jgi:hypothetical protein
MPSDGIRQEAALYRMEQDGTGVPGTQLAFFRSMDFERGNEMRDTRWQEKLAAKRQVRIENHVERLCYQGEALVRTHDMDDVVDNLEAIGVGHSVERHGRGLWWVVVVDVEVANG